ncbi:MAG: hypothetical protein U0527_15150 [Candidatus Eisenbacteria bacterium]
MSNGAAAIAQLEAIRSNYGAGAAAERKRLFASIENSHLDEPEDLLRLHELLLFWRAYPDDESALGAAERGLQALSKRVSSLSDRREELRDSGLPGTSNVHTYSWSMLRELLPAFGDRLEVAWQEVDDSSPFFELIGLCVATAEVPGVDDDRLEGDSWLLAARSKRERSDLQTLYHLLEGTTLPEQAREALFDRLRLPIRWELTGVDDAKCAAIRKRRRTHFQAGPLERSAVDLAAQVRQPLLAVERLDLAEARSAIRWMNAAMSVRNRELYPLCHPEERDAVRVQCERGLEIYTFGVRPPRRLLIEGLYGQFLVKNGVPIGYALSSVVGRVCEVGLNIYDTYRAGESAFIYGQLLQTFAQLYGAEWFWIPRLQAGYGNDEGLQSGAFWFYDKLGFRSLDPKIAARADRERARRAGQPSYRSSIATLRTLVDEDLCWAPPGVQEPGLFPLGEIGLAITRWIAERWEGDRERALRWAEREAQKRLGLRAVSRDREAEREAFRRLAPLVALIPDWRDWSTEERNRLARLVRAKGSARESEYIAQSRALPRWLTYLRQLGQT